MNPQQALNLIEQALNMATTKGAFTMADVQAILQAMTVLKTAHPASDEAGS